MKLRDGRHYTDACHSSILDNENIQSHAASFDIVLLVVQRTLPIVSNLSACHADSYASCPPIILEKRAINIQLPNVEVRVKPDLVAHYRII